MINTISHTIDKFNLLVGRSIAWLTVLMVLITFLIVVMRYGFNVGSIALQESVIYMHAFVFMLGVAVTLQKNEHVRVDIFYQKMSQRSKAIVNCTGVILLLLPLCGFIAWSSWEYVVESWELKEGSREAGGLPWVYILKSCIIAMVVLLTLQAISEFLKNLITIIRPSKQETE